MTLGRAIELIVREYDKAKKQNWIRNPLAYALHKVWKIADTEREEE